MMEIACWKTQVMWWADRSLNHFWVTYQSVTSSSADYISDEAASHTMFSFIYIFVIV